MRTPATDSPVEQVDASYLESLVGYNARRATLVIVEVFLQRMAVYDLRPVDFSVLSLIHHNPGVTSRQICVALGIQPPNLVVMLNTLEKKELLSRRPHPHDGRAMGLLLTPGGKKMMQKAEQTAVRMDQDATARLSPSERQTLMRLLRKIYN
jgi:DNA-binding MarR family transcriptional regulator